MGGRRSLTSKQVTEIGLIQVTRKLKGVARNLDEADFRYLLGGQRTPTAHSPQWLSLHILCNRTINNYVSRDLHFPRGHYCLQYLYLSD